jgi:NTP pyrophosphatase (non-canonical NTP hydrolase)
MSIYTNLDFADKFSDFALDLAEWSQRTFGTDKERGPIGALKHLQLEVQETIDAIKHDANWKEELADCFILIIDASRRAGIKPMQLLEAAQAKMKINKTRTYGPPVKDEAVRHLP